MKSLPTLSEDKFVEAGYEVIRSWDSHSESVDEVLRSLFRSLLETQQTSTEREAATALS